MKLHYFFRYVSKAEREFLSNVLMEELQLQSWYAVTWSALLGGETIVYVQ
jgi:hypothetical protein